MVVPEKGDYFISVGSEKQQKSFRVFLLNSQGEVKYSQIVKNGEFLFCQLNAEEYEIYINPIPN